MGGTRALDLHVDAPDGEGGAAVEASQPEAARNLQRRQPRRRRALPINTVAEVSGLAEGDEHC